MATIVTIVMIVAFAVTPEATATTTTTSTAATSAIAYPSDGESISIMVVGDSISVGCGTTPLTGWCADLSTLLTERGIAHSIDAHAISGWSCISLAAGFPARFDAIQPHLVIMACGTNDAPSTQAAMDAMGEKWRTMVEYAWTHRGTRDTRILPVFIQYSDIEINEENGRSWLLSGEGRANDTIYVNMNLYDPSVWFAGLADLQRVPGDLNYLIGGTDGIHPNQLGNHVYADIFYRAVKDHYGWPDTVGEPCGMFGHRWIYWPPPFIPCTSTS